MAVLDFIKGKAKEFREKRAEKRESQVESRGEFFRRTVRQEREKEDIASLKRRAKMIAKAGGSLSLAFREARARSPQRLSLFRDKIVKVPTGKFTKKGQPKFKSVRTKGVFKPQGARGFVEAERRQVRPLDMGLIGMPEGSRAIEMLNTTDSQLSAEESNLNPRRKGNGLSLR